MSDIISDVYFDKNRGYYVEVFDDKSRPLFVVCIGKESKLEEVLPADTRIDSRSNTIKDLAEFNGIRLHPIENQLNIVYQVMDVDEVKLKNLISVSDGVCKFNLFGVKHFVDLDDYLEKDYTEVVANSESHSFTSPKSDTVKEEPKVSRKDNTTSCKPKEPNIKEETKKGGSSGVKKSSSFN